MTYPEQVQAVARYFGWQIEEYSYGFSIYRGEEFSLAASNYSPEENADAILEILLYCEGIVAFPY